MTRLEASHFALHDYEWLFDAGKEASELLCFPGFRWYSQPCGGDFVFIVLY